MITLRSPGHVPANRTVAIGHDQGKRITVQPIYAGQSVSCPMDETARSVTMRHGSLICANPQRGQSQP
jgi:hypothetical protein